MGPARPGGVRFVTPEIKKKTLSKISKKLKRVLFVNISNKTIDKHFYLNYHIDRKQTGGNYNGKQHYIRICSCVFG
jgi:tRNA(Ile2) C34 agmatinyltransferase TiaS